MLQAKDIMTAEPVCCTPDSSLADAARLMMQNDCGALPVIDGKETAQPLGIITDRDIVCRALAIGKDPLKMTVRDCMSGPCVTIGADASIDDCCDTMEANQIRRIVVVNSDDHCCGIIAQADVAQAAPEAKTAEVVREISLSTQAVQGTF
jgi:CBS domain-containing protein